MNQEGVLLWKKCVRQNSLTNRVRSAGRSFAWKTIDFDVVTLAPNNFYIYTCTVILACVNICCPGNKGCPKGVILSQVWK